MIFALLVFMAELFNIFQLIYRVVIGSKNRQYPFLGTLSIIAVTSKLQAMLKSGRVITLKLFFTFIADPMVSVIRVLTKHWSTSQV